MPGGQHRDKDPLVPGPVDELLDLGLAAAEVALLSVFGLQIEALEVTEAAEPDAHDLSRELDLVAVLALLQVAE